MKFFNLCSLSILMLILCSCHKDHQPPGEQPVDVYVYGSLWHGSSTTSPTSADAVYYKNGMQVILNDSGISEPSTYVLTVNSLAVSGDTVYAGGSSTNNSYVTGSTLPVGPVYWINSIEHVLQVTNTISPVIVGIAANGKSFYTLYRGVPYPGNDGGLFKLGGIAINGSVKYEYNDVLIGLMVSGTDLYTYGYGESNATFYKNNQLVTFQLPANTNVVITGMCISGKDVYACGILTNTNSSVPAYWKNGQLTMLTSDTDTNTNPTGIAVQGENIYISGSQTTIGTNANGLPTKEAILWKNGLMTKLAAPSGYNSYTNGVVVSGNDVYVSGRAGSDSDCTVYWRNGTPVNFKIPAGYAFVNKGITIVPQTGH